MTLTNKDLLVRSESVAGVVFKNSLIMNKKRKQIESRWLAMHVPFACLCVGGFN